MMGILGGAMAGVGGAIEENARGTMDEQREQRLMALREKYQVRAEGRAAEREEQAWERQAEHEGEMWERDRAAQVEDRDLGFAHDQRMQGARAQQAGSGSWQMVQGEDGQMYQYNPVTNEHRPADLPAGAQMGDGDGRMSERQQQRYTFLDDRVKEINERLQEDLAMDESTRDDLLRQQSSYLSEMDAMTGGQAGSAGGSLEDRIAGRLGAGGEGAGGEGSDPSKGQGLLDSARSVNQEREENRAQAERRREIDGELSEIERAVRSRSADDSGVLPGGTDAVMGRETALPADQARAYLERLEAIEGDLTPRQRATAARLAQQLLPIADD